VHRLPRLVLQGNRDPREAQRAHAPQQDAQASVE
jgi:hypothetical protein